MIQLLNSLRDIAPSLGQQMVNGALEGMILAFLAWALLRFIAKPSSGTKFAVWFSVLLFVAAAPFLGMLQYGGDLLGAGQSNSAIRLPQLWAVYAFGLWAMISAIGMIRLAFGLWQLSHLRRNSTVVEMENLDRLWLGSLQTFRKTRPLELRVSERVNVPAAIGFFRPAVILPRWVLQELSAEEIHTVLLHEMAHLQRRDDWTNLIQKALRAVFFFHPAVWWIESKLSLEREMACDDIVLAHTGDGRGYAQCLVSMAEKSYLHKGLALAQAAVSRMRHTTARVSRILCSGRAKTTQAWKLGLGMAGLFAVAVLISPHAPKLVAFEDTRPGNAVITQARSAGPELQQTSGEMEGDVSPVRVVPAEFKTPVRAPASVASLHRKPIHRPAIATTPASGMEAQEVLIPASATEEAARPVVHEAVFVVVQMTKDARGFFEGWDVYVIRLTLPSQNASPINAGTFKKT